LTIEYSPAREGLGHTAPLDFAVTYPVLGVPIRFQSNSRTVIEHVNASFGQWAHLPAEWVRDQLPCEQTIIVHPVQASDGKPHKFTYRIHSNIFLAANSETLFYADNTRGQAMAFVPPEVVANGLHFRYNVVESLALYLASVEERVAIHGGAILYQGTTIMLMGKSTVGKSTLCYAALRSGDFDLLAEDVLYAQVDPTPQLFGGMGRLHLLPDAPRHFPELADTPPQLQANGKVKIGVAVPPERVRLHAAPGILCLLQREEGDSTPAITPISREAMLAYLSNPDESGYDLFDSRLQRTAVMLADYPAYRLTVGADFDAALALLKNIITNPIPEAHRP
jgi:hypothetical protein